MEPKAAPANQPSQGGITLNTFGFVEGAEMIVTFRKIRSLVIRKMKVQI